MRTAPLLVLVLLAAWTLAADAPARREFPATETQRAALERINEQGVDLERLRKQLDDGDKALRVRFDRFLAEVHSALAPMGVRSDAQVNFDPQKGVFYVSDAAPVISQDRK